MSLARNTFVQTFMTLGSRLLGFARDLALNARFGQGPMMDAFATALMFPNLFRRLFAEGAFAQAFVPVYGKVRAEEGEEAATKIASQTMSFLLAVVVAFCIVAQIAMSWIMPVLLSAYAADKEMMRLATLVTQLTMPYLACMTLAALLSGILNTAGRFALSAGVPILLNVCTIAPLVLIEDRESALVGAAIAVSVAGLLQAGLLWWGVRRQGIALRFGMPMLSQTVRRVLVLAIPGALAGGATQINSLVSQILTGSDAGARSVLYNADRLYQLPLGLVGVAVGLALVPRLTKAFVAGDHDGAQSTLDDGIGLSMAFTIPSAAALIVMPFFIIDATVTRGVFTSDDARRTAEVLRHFGWGVPAFVLAKVLTPPFFARQDTKRPMRYAFATVAVTVALGAALFFGFKRIGWDGVVGLAAATSIGAWVNVALLSGTLAREGVWKVGPALRGRLVRLAVATAIMAAVLGVMAFYYPTLAQLLWRKEVAVIVACFVGAGVYGAAALAVGAITLAEMRAALRREPGAPGSGGGLPGGPDG
jgi:putative peptidoglycan lipid II flippase